MWWGYGLDWRELPMRQLWVIAWFSGITIFVWLFLLWRYKTVRLVLDRESLTCYGLWGHKRVFFEQVAALGRDELGFYIETQDGKRPIRWGASLASNTELVEELERRANVTMH